METKLFIKRKGYSFFLFDDKEGNLLYVIEYQSKIFGADKAFLKNSYGDVLVDVSLSRRSGFGYKQDFQACFYYLNSLQTVIHNISFSKGHWKLEVHNNSFDFYINQHSKYSIFKNNKQIAGIKTNAVEVLNTSEYNFISIDPETLVIQLTLFFIANFRKNNDANLFTINFSVSPYSRFNEKWSAK